MTVKDIPIIFSAPMIRALLDGRKTMTRRLAMRKEPVPCSACHQSGGTPESGFMAVCGRCNGAGVHGGKASPWQKVKPGDRLWVRETLTRSGGLVQYAADHRTLTRAWPPEWQRDPRPSIHMPRWASRLTLPVAAVKVERLQDISEEDAKAEGVARNPVQQDTWIDYPEGSSAAGWLDPRRSFRSLWCSLHSPDVWEAANPEVVAISFRVERRNIDCPGPSLPPGTHAVSGEANKTTITGAEGA